MSLPVLVLTPGAWHTPETYGKIIPKLEASGFMCQALSLPSVGRNPPVTDLSQDIDTIREAVISQSDAGNDVVIVSHSWSGAPANSALEGLSKKERTSSGKKGGVVKLIFMTAFVVPKGVSLFDALGGQVPDLWDIDGDIIHARNPIPAFYHDLDPDEAKYYASLLKPHAKASNYAKTSGEAWKTIPSVYLICEDDFAIPSLAQEAMVEAVQKAGAEIQTERIKSSHSPFLSHPDTVVDFITRHAMAK